MVRRAWTRSRAHCPLWPIPRPPSLPRKKIDQGFVLGIGPCAWPYVLGICRHVHQARGRGHRRMRTCAGAGSKSRQRPCFYRTWQDLTSAAPKKPRRTSARPCASVRAIRCLMSGSLWRAWRRTTSAATNKRLRGFDGRSRPTEIFRSRIFILAAALAQLGRLDEAHSAVKAGVALNPSFTLSRARAHWTALSDDPTYLAQIEPILEGMRMAGLREE